MPGRAVMYQPVRRASRPRPIIEPQLTWLGSPRPRKERPASDRIALATSRPVETITGVQALGRISRNTRCRSLAPRATLARTNSRSRSEMNSARTSRAMLVHEVTPSANTMVPTEGVSTATRMIASRKAGMVWKNSVMRVSTASTLPR